MTHTIIYDPATRAVLVIDPPTDEDGAPILPFGVKTAAVTISDVEAAKFSTPDSVFTLAADNATVQVGAPPPPPPPDPVVIAAQQQRVADAAELLNAPAVRDTQKHRDAFARLIGVKALHIPLTQDAAPQDIQPL